MPSGCEFHDLAAGTYRIHSKPSALSLEMIGYHNDLAYIHESGYARFAVGAAATILHHLPSRDGTLLDLGCGGGTLARMMVDAGLQVVGCDASDAMIDLARTKVPEASFTVGSFIDVDFPSCIAVTAIGEVFNYMFDERNGWTSLQSVLTRIYSSLSPSGILVFDIAGPDRASAQPAESFRSTTDWTILVRTSTDGDTLVRQIISFRRVNALYRRSDEQHRLRLMDPGIIAQYLEAVGFEVSQLAKYGDQALPQGLHGFLARKPSANVAKP